jgi:hypothetical protein
MIPAFVVILTVALSAPIAVHAEDQILADEPVLVAEGQVPALAPGAVSANSDDRIATALFGAPTPVPVPVPRLTDVSATTQTPRLFTVTGTGFTPGGRVYLAIYDQMGAQLYETRWITASPALAVEAGPTDHEAAFIDGSGGTLRETFANLCGATAMMRAYDEATTTWSTWLPVEPACAAYVEPRSGPR